LEFECYCFLKIASYFVEISGESENLLKWGWPGYNLLGGRNDTGKFNTYCFIWFMMCHCEREFETLNYIWWLFWNYHCSIFIISFEIYKFMRMFDIPQQNLVILDLKGVGGSTLCWNTSFGLVIIDR
jgi:hypothetical protein